MITKREGIKRGQIKLSWLNGKYTFSFGSYFDPDWMCFGPLRVINEDIIAEGRGFETHPHRDMEIISYILAGELEHIDTLGNRTKIKSNQIQIMSAGTGIEHSEFNSKSDEKTHMLQIWIEPNKHGIPPRYDQFDVEIKENQLTLIASEFGGKNIALINQDVKIHHGRLNEFSQKLNSQKKYWVQIAKGEGSINGLKVIAGDGVAIENETDLNIQSCDGLDVLFFEIF